MSASGTMGGKPVDLYTAGTFKITSVASKPNGDVILNTNECGGVTMDDISKYFNN